MCSILPFMFKVFLEIKNLKVYNKINQELVCKDRRKTVTHYYDGRKEIKNPLWFCKCINLDGQTSLVCIFSPSFYTWNLDCFVSQQPFAVEEWDLPGVSVCSVAVGFGFQTVLPNHCCWSRSRQLV